MERIEGNAKTSYSQCIPYLSLRGEFTQNSAAHPRQSGFDWEEEPELQIKQ